MSTKYDDYEEFLKKTLAAKGVYYFGPIKGLETPVEKTPLMSNRLGTLIPNDEPAEVAEAPAQSFVPTNPVEPQRTEPTPLMSGPPSLIDRVEPMLRQFTVAVPNDTGQLHMALRVTLTRQGDILVQGPMSDYAARALNGPLEGRGVVAGTAAFYKLANTTWGPATQVFKINVD